MRASNAICCRDGGERRFKQANHDPALIEGPVSRRNPATWLRDHDGKPTAVADFSIPRPRSLPVALHK